MTFGPIVNPFQPLVGLTGIGLNAGALYIGVDGMDPQTHPQACYWDAAGTVPASQPIDILGGYPMRLGTPARVYTDTTYSIRVRARDGSQVFYEASVVPGATTRDGIFATIASAAAAIIPPPVRTVGVTLLGYYAAQDGGGGAYRYSLTEPAHAGKFQSVDGAWWELAETVVRPEMFGARANGVTDDTTAINNALEFGPTVLTDQSVYFTATGVVITRDSTSLTGQGTLLMSSSNTSSYSVTTGIAVVTVLSADGVVISDIIVDSANVATGRGISAADFDGLTIRNVAGKNTGQMFIRAGGLVKSLVVEDCRNPFKGYGILINDPAAGSSGFVATGNIFRGTSSGQSDGIEVNAPTNGFNDVVVTGNIVSGMWGNALNAGIGIGFAKVQNAVISGNVISDCENDGIHIEDLSENITIVGNTVEGCCRTLSGASGGIAILTGSSRITIGPNTIRDTIARAALTFFSPLGQFSEDISVSGGVYDGAPLYLINIDSVKRLRLTGMAIHNANVSNTANTPAIRVISNLGNVSQDISISAVSVRAGTNAVRSIAYGPSCVSGADLTGNSFIGVVKPDLGGNSVNVRTNRYSNADLMQGSFVFTAGSSFATVNNANLDTIDGVMVWPADAAARALAPGYVSGLNPGVLFTYELNVVAAGGETFWYAIL